MDLENFYQRFCKEGFDENGVLNYFEPVIADNFNFAYDVVDEIARLEPNRRAMVWCNVAGEERVLTFGEMEALFRQMRPDARRPRRQKGRHGPAGAEKAL